MSGIVTITELLLSLFCGMLRVRTWYEIRPCVFDCCVGRETMLLSWLDLLLSTNHTHTVTAGTNKGMSLKHGACCCTTAAVVLLYGDFVTAYPPRTHTRYG